MITVILQNKIIQKHRSYKILPFVYQMTFSENDLINSSNVFCL